VPEARRSIGCAFFLESGHFHRKVAKDAKEEREFELEYSPRHPHSENAREVLPAFLSVLCAFAVKICRLRIA
jgi:hypothetical protein